MVSDVRSMHTPWVCAFKRQREIIKVGFVHVTALIMIYLEELEKDQLQLIWKYLNLNLLITTQLKLIKIFMSDHEYTPKSKAGKWFNDRLPLLTLGSHLTDYPTPKNLNYWWTFGGILTFCLLTQIITGIVLAMHYVAHADLAFASVEHIMRNVNYGWLIRYIHSNGASMFFLAVYIHIFRSLFYGSYKSPREVIWIIGLLIYLLMMATAFMGYVLPWGQMSFGGNCNNKFI